MKLLTSEPSRVSLILESPEDTDGFARIAAHCLRPSMAVLLEGDLGAGKTTLIRALCEALGWKGAKSPSFSLVNQYESAVIPIAHADLYRLPQVDPRDLGLEDYLDDGWLLFIEWPCRMGRRDFENSWSGRLSVIDENQRQLSLEASGSEALQALAELEEGLR